MTSNYESVQEKLRNPFRTKGAQRLRLVLGVFEALVVLFLRIALRIDALFVGLQRARLFLAFFVFHLALLFGVFHRLRGSARRNGKSERRDDDRCDQTLHGSSFLLKLLPTSFSFVFLRLPSRAEDCADRGAFLAGDHVTGHGADGGPFRFAVMLDVCIFGMASFVVSHWFLQSAKKGSNGRAAGSLPEEKEPAVPCAAAIVLCPQPDSTGFFRRGLRK